MQTLVIANFEVSVNKVTGMREVEKILEFANHTGPVSNDIFSIHHF